MKKTVPIKLKAVQAQKPLDITFRADCTKVLLNVYPLEINISVYQIHSPWPPLVPIHFA